MSQGPQNPGIRSVKEQYVDFLAGFPKLFLLFGSYDLLSLEI